MIKRELKSNLKSFIIWTSIISLMFIIVFLVYPSISQNGEMIDQFIQMMPENILALFNMNIISLNKVSGWFATEGYMMVTLLGSCYVAIMGSHLLTKEEDEQTIYFLYSKPISRGKIYINKIIVGIFYILMFNLTISIVNLIGLNLSNDFIFIKWFLLSLSPIILHLFIFFLTILISIFFTKTRKSMSTCLGITFGLYLINILSNLTDKLSFLKYFSPFTYVDSSIIMLDNTVNFTYFTICIFLIAAFSISSYIIYDKKEFL